MARFAIVIGIDNYVHPDWRLDAAVDDAMRFAQWATSAGGVEPENLRLLLSPVTPVATALRYQPADARTIRKTILEFQEGGGTGGDRLYVYFGGHGLSAPGATKGVAQEPVLVPSDVESIAVDRSLLLGFSEIISVLGGVDPVEQFFFLDACRDFQLENFLPAVGQGVGPWAPTREDGASSRQFVLYATSPGQRAFEVSARRRGIFAGRLLEALSGKLPAASVYTSGRDRYEVRFSTLTDHLRASVSEQVAVLADRQRYVQLPEPLALRGADAVIADFSVEQMGTVPVRVRIGPSKARPSCRVQLSYAVPGVPGGHVLRQAGPPTEASTTLDIAPGVYSLQAEASGYRRFREPCDATAARTIDVRLEIEPIPPLPPPPRPQEPLPTTGSLVAFSSDPTALIVVRDTERAIRGSGSVTLSLNDLPHGIYSVQLLAAEGGSAEQMVEVTPGPGTVLSLDAPGPRIGRGQQQMLNALNIHTVNGYLHPSEALDGFANASFASLMAFAAFAAHWPDAGVFSRLREFGVPAITGIPTGRAALMVLVGVSGDRPSPGVGRDEFLGSAEVVVRDLEGTRLDVGPLQLLSGMPVAGQTSTQLAPGSVIAELRLPGLAPTRYALAALPDRLTLLVAAAEDSGEVELQQYLVPLQLSGQEMMKNPSNIRRLELAQRVYARSRKLPPGAADDMLYVKWFDPLLGALAGYSLIHAGHPELYRGVALENMLKHFSGLPDSHVLAGLCDPERRDEHFAEAARLGLPVFADGFRALYDWCTEHESPGRSLWTAPEMLLPGSPWTAWVASRPALRVVDSSMQTPPIGWEVLEKRRAKIDRVLPGVGRVIRRGAGYPLSATAFLVAPDIAMTMEAALPGGDTARCVIDFADDDGGPAREFEVVEMLATGGADPSAVQFALVRVVPVSAGGGLPEPLALASRLPTPSHGRTVVVVGFPMRDARVPDEVQQLTFDDVYGVKRVQPGQILALTDGGLQHDCLTLGGNGGSPVIDVESGLVLGFHHSGRWVEFKRGDATALWTPDQQALLSGLGVRYEEPA